MSKVKSLPSEVANGVEVKDRLTGFKGIVTSMTTYITGCVHAGVQPKVTKEGAYPDALGFDISRLDVIGWGEYKEDIKEGIKEEIPGGPQKMPRSV